MPLRFFTKRARAVLIDHNNVTLAGLTKPDRREAVVPRLLDWDVFRRVVESCFDRKKSFVFEKKGVFVKLSPSGPDKPLGAQYEWARKAKLRWEESGYSFTSVMEKDVDSWIVDELWSIADTACNTHKCKELHYVIASGDGVFARVLKKIIAQYKGRMRIRVSVCSWHDGLNHEWVDLVGSKEVLVLDTVNNLERQRYTTLSP